MTLDQETEEFLAAANARPPRSFDNVDIAQFRLEIEAFRRYGFDREEVAFVADVDVPNWADAPYRANDDVPVRVYKPDAPGPLPVIAYVHGGSWVRATVDLFDTYYRVLANRSGCAVAAIDYQLAPEARFPQAVEEVQAVGRWLKAEGAKLGLDPARIAIAGESSGANVSAAVTLADRAKREVGFVFQCLIVPLLESSSFESGSWRELGAGYMLTAEQLDWALSMYAPAGDRTDPLLSPLRATDLSDLPRALLVAGGCDPLRDDAVRYADRLEHAGVATELVVVEGLIHHAVILPKAISLGGRVVEEVAAKIGVALREIG